MAIELIVAGPGKLSHPSRSCVCGSAGSCQVIVGLLVYQATQFPVWFGVFLQFHAEANRARLLLCVMGEIKRTKKKQRRDTLNLKITPISWIQHLF